MLLKFFCLVHLRWNFLSRPDGATIDILIDGNKIEYVKKCLLRLNINRSLNKSRRFGLLYLPCPCWPDELVFARCKVGGGRPRIGWSVHRGQKRNFRQTKCHYLLTKFKCPLVVSKNKVNMCYESCCVDNFLAVVDSFLCGQPQRKLSIKVVYQRSNTFASVILIENTIVT